jgi:hypothetical protein
MIKINLIVKKLFVQKASIVNALFAVFFNIQNNVENICLFKISLVLKRKHIVSIVIEGKR